MTRIGYVLKVYPRFSETFIVTEILAREALGDQLDIYALRPTTDARFHPEIARIKANVHWVRRPNLGTGFWEEMASALHHPHLGNNFLNTLPQLVELPFDEVSQGLTLARMAYDDGITHLHAHFASLPGRMAWIASKITGIPYTITTHAKDIFHKSVNPEWLKLVCSEAEQVIAISQYNKEYLEKVLHGTNANITLRYNALELERFPFSAPLPITDTLKILAIGRLVPKKGFTHLIDAVAKLRDAGQNIELTIGGAGELAAELQHKITSLNLEDHARLIGPINQAEVRDLIHNSHVFVAPCVPATDGNIDGLPTVVLEAMASGIPVIATAVTGLPEVIRDNETGVLLEPGDTDGLVDALQRLIDGKTDIGALTRNARTLIEDHFDSRQQAAQLSSWQSG